MELDEAQSSEKIVPISWAAERFFLTVATSKILLPYPSIELEDGIKGQYFYCRHLLHHESSKDLNWIDYNIRGISLKENFGTIFQNYLLFALENPNQYYPLLSELFYPTFMEQNLLYLASAFEDLIWPRKENGERDEKGKSSKKNTKY
ncbi:hypothetical protein FAI40_07980 [Acetobacteraceae bacterium]|nr:hypothetical protein FAI40_07980 [Acetobacteraceae bacterium]